MTRDEVVAEWREQICAPALYSSRLMFALCVALAAPMQRLFGRRAHAFHFYGDASAGHAAGLYLAAGLYGNAGELRSWPEFARDPPGVADEDRDGPLVLDDFDGIDDAARTAAAGAIWSDPARAFPVGLSAGIAPFEGGESSVEATVIDIPADAGRGLGVFEREIRGGAPDVCAGMIARNALSFDGAVGSIWLGVLIEGIAHLDEVEQTDGPSGRGAYLDSIGFSQADPMGPFQMLAFAGQLATARGLTGWAELDARDAIGRCVRASAAARGPSELAMWGHATSSTQPTTRAE